MEPGLRVFGALLKVITILTWPIFYILSWRTPKKLPPITSPLLKESATSLARKIRLGELTSESLLGEFIKRVEEVNPHLNAVVQRCYETALNDARAVDKLVASGTKTALQMEIESPFLGVPFTVKGSCGLKGTSEEVGSLSLKGLKSAADGEAVRNVRRAGAIPIALSTVPELCLSWETNNLITGKTVNPYDSNRTSGGSSGGEAALIGAAASVIGIGSDIAGSIRIPAMYNGIFGHKPTPGVISIKGHVPNLANDSKFERFLVIGPLARYAEDLRPMVRLMAGENASQLRLDEKVNLKSLNIFYMEDAGYSVIAVQVETEIKKVLHKAVQHLRHKHGSYTQQVNFKELEESIEISCSVFFGLKGLPNLLKNENNPKESHNLYYEFIKSLFGLSKISRSSLGFYFLYQNNAFIAKHKYNDFWSQNEALRRKFMNLLKDNGVFFYPTHPTPALYHNESFTKTAGVMYTMIFNVLGLPSTHVPLGLNKAGLPIGIQVVAAPYQDRLCLAVAEELEKQFGGWIPPPSTL